MNPSLNPEISYFAKVDFRNDRRLFGIAQNSRLNSMYILGKTGSGKTNLMKTLMYQDVIHKRGFCLFDVNGDVLKEVLSLIPKERDKDIVYLDAGNINQEWGYNPLRKVAYQTRPLIASSILETFKKLWGTQSWGLKLEYILRNTILTLLDQDKASFEDIPRLLLDESYRALCISKIINSHVKRFWLLEYPKYSKSDILPVLNKVGSFLSVPVLNKILTKNTKQLSLRSIMDNEKIFLVNLAKGQVGSDGAHLLGSLLLTSLSSASFTRVDTEPSERKPFHIYLDEFQNYTTGSLVNSLSELRKFGVSFILAHQYLHQISNDIRNAVLGNVGTIICFTLGQADSVYMAKEFYPVFETQDFINLPHYSIYLKLLVDGKTLQGFSATTIRIEDLKYNLEYLSGG